MKWVHDAQEWRERSWVGASSQVCCRHLSVTRSNLRPSQPRFQIQGQLGVTARRLGPRCSSSQIFSGSFSVGGRGAWSQACPWGHRCGQKRKWVCASPTSPPQHSLNEQWREYWEGNRYATWTTTAVDFQAWRKLSGEKEKALKWNEI